MSLYDNLPSSKQDGSPSESSGKPAVPAPRSLAAKPSGALSLGMPRSVVKKPSRAPVPGFSMPPPKAAKAAPPVPGFAAPKPKAKPAVPGFGFNAPKPVSKAPVPSFGAPAPKKPVPTFGALSPKQSNAPLPMETDEDDGGKVEEEIVDEYNPARPNDYEEYCLERERRRQREKEEAERAKREAAFRPPPPISSSGGPKNLNLKISADEMFARRQAMSVSKGPVGNVPKDKDGFAAPMGKPKKAISMPSRVICMTNMVGRNEVDNELEGEIHDECAKYGVVLRCKVHVMPANRPDNEAVRIFVQYSTITSATKALKVMNGRFFGGRTVKAVYYNEKSFNSGTYHE